MTNTKKIRLKDIAYALNISVTCVSRSLRDCDDISEDTKRAVRQKALELGYRSKYDEIKTKEKHVVALIIDSIKNPYFIKLGDILLSKLNKEECDFLIMITNPYEKVNDTLIKKCIYRNADVILSFNEFSSKSIDIAKLNNIPLVMLGRIPELDYADGIYTDDVDGGKLAFEKLYYEGKRKLAYLEETRSEASLRRLEGFESASYSDDYSIDVYDCNSLDLVINKIINNQIDGVFAYNDMIAEMLFNFVEEKCPNKLNDLYVIGYDGDLPNLSKIYTNFSSITFDYDLIGDDVMNIIRNKVIKKKPFKRYLYKIDVNLK